MSRWAKDATERVFWTFTAVFLGLYLMGLNALPNSLESLADLSVLSKACAGAVIATLTLLKTVAARRVGNPDSASTTEL